MRFSDLVTRNGECFESEYQREKAAPKRSGALHLFKIMDRLHGRGERVVQLYCAERFKQLAKDSHGNIEFRVGPNVIRRAIDAGEFSFEAPYDEHRFKEIKLQKSDFEDQPKATDPELMQFILHKAYLVGYKLNPHVGLYAANFEDSLDLAYLGVGHSDVRRIVWRLRELGLLSGKGKNADDPHVTGKLVNLYESQHGARLLNEYVFPKGTQFDAYKAVRQILQSAQRDILIVDNYLSDDILDTIAVLPTKVKARLLTSKVEPDFIVAINRFRSQYSQHHVEARKQKAEIHDRVIAIDGTHLYSLGHSIKGIGAKLSLINKLEDINAIKKLRDTLEQVWLSASVIA